MRWADIIGSNDNYESPTTLGIIDVLRAHFLIADFFLAEGKGLGGVGPRDIELLNSALYRPFMCYGGVCKWTSPFEKAATVLFGLVMDHPFHDANKRTAFLSILFLLQKMGYTPTVSHKEFEDFLVEIADRKLDVHSRFQQYRKKHDDPEIKFIAWWLKAKTRPVDKRQYIITYRDLARILGKFNFFLENPHHNSIEVVEYKERFLNPFGLFDKKIRNKLGNIGFPGWTRQVYKGELKRVRDLTGLTEANGYDSQVFYQDADPLSQLINEYQEPLRRLADR